MTTIVSIDPGKWVLPWCGWQDGTLAYAGLSVIKPEDYRACPLIASMHARNVDCPWFPGGFDVAVIEELSLNTGRDSTRGKAIATGNDLLDLTRIAASFAGVALRPSGETRYLPVNTWKGSAPKQVTKNRVLATLSPAELAVLERAFVGVRKGLHHNLYDAAGIGLCATRRYVVRR